MARFAYLHGLLGHDEAASQYFSEIEAAATEVKLRPGTWAYAFLAIRDEQQALRWLNVAADEGTGGLGLEHNIYSDPILDQREFVEVRSRLGFGE